MAEVSIFIAKGWLMCYFRFVPQAPKFKNSIFLASSRYLGIKKWNWPRENLSLTEWYVDCSFILYYFSWDLEVEFFFCNPLELEAAGEISKYSGNCREFNSFFLNAMWINLASFSAGIINSYIFISICFQVGPIALNLPLVFVAQRRFFLSFSRILRAKCYF